MRKLKRTELLVLLLPTVLFAGVAVATRLKKVADEHLKTAIVGKWRGTTNGTIVEIRKDHSQPGIYKGENTYKGQKVLRTYKFVDNKHIQVDGPDLPPATIRAQVKISGDRLFITYVDPDGRPSPPFEELKRIK